jgi:hypothetical protein
MTRQSSFIAGGVAALLIGLSAQANAATITTLYNTGVADGTHVALPDGSPDPHYKLVSAPPHAVTDLVTGKASSGHYPVSGPYHPGDNSTSDWIGPNSNGIVGGLHQYFLGPAGPYEYETTFSLAGFNPSTAVINGQWSADNSGIEILLNGTPVFFTANINQFQAGFANFSITSGFKSGPNTLDFIITNSPSSFNPTALRVEMTGTADPASAIPEPASLIVFGAFGCFGLVGYGWKRRKVAV